MPITTTPSGGPQGEFSTNTPIYSTTLSATATSVTFSNIPSTFTDLVLVVNGSFSGTDYLNLQFNGDTSTSYSDLPFRGNGSTASAGAASSRAFIHTAVDATVNARFMCRSNIQNYANPNINKSVLSRGDSATGYVSVSVGTWRKTEPITSIRVYALSGNNFTVGSTFTIYGIKAAAPAPKATGGDLVYTDNTYWYHVFNNSGVLDVKTPMNVDYLVVAGGGAACLAGGGAGGVRSTVTATGGGGSLESQLSLTPIQYPITVGAGGATIINAIGVNGNNSTLATITSTGGGGGNSEGDGVAGGSGGGGGTGAPAATRAGGAASPSGQGYAGGGTNSGRNRASGGGGGAGAVGNTNSLEQTGAGGGAGITVFGRAIGGGGGGGGRAAYVNGAGVNFGGGSGGTYTGGAEAATNGTTNTGGGGGGGWETNRNGGSGLVIVRYPV